ncbi:PspA/IM30 family protein [Cytobacillus horneckiae]|uniref:Modulator protein n=1 Tax=Cytobacillus horneckiae TaxID=549687 RepID=A0A2N0ZEG2_9BACI|nr:PspA/IM30 family protein [Cytobacillus horneckiae]MEC1154697.1 PspA/IM30 family protein [Cytobacillus horneckiae]MED2939038.1 PspA/IM30 family protein [Cytobacillus horneckiae]PKG27887.1 modulator protein [Cytobacillus horneckiae]
MTNILTRLKNTIAADINDALDRKEKKNPIAMLNQYLRESEQETEKVRKLIERQYKLTEEFRLEHKQAVELASKRKRQAEIAAEAGDTELHEFALAEYAQYEERSGKLQTIVFEAEKQLTELERKYEEMKHKLKDMQIRRMELMGRENVTRAQTQMSKVLHNEEYSYQSYSKFQEIETYIDNLEKKVENAYYRSNIDAKVAQLEKSLKKDDSVSN